jgi:hypothetical protein
MIMSIQRFAKAAAAIPLFMSLGCAAQMSQADLVGMQFPAERAPVSRNILMVVGNENGVVNYGTSIADVFVKNRLELDMGHTVTRMRDNAPADSLLMAANAADLVIIAESVTSGALNTKIVSTATPIFSYEAFLQDEFGLVNPQGGSDAHQDRQPQPSAGGRAVGARPGLSFPAGDELGQGDRPECGGRGDPSGLSGSRRHLRHPEGCAAL